MSKAIELGKNNYDIYKDLCTPVDMLDIPQKEIELWKQINCYNIYEILKCGYRTSNLVKDKHIINVKYFYNTLSYLFKIGYIIPYVTLSKENNIDYSKAFSICDASEDYISLDSSIEALDLSVRTFNGLKRAGVETVRDITLRTDEDIIAIRNMGRKAYDEIKSVLALHGLQLKQS